MESQLFRRSVARFSGAKSAGIALGIGVLASAAILADVRGGEPGEGYVNLMPAITVTATGPAWVALDPAAYAGGGGGSEIDAGSAHVVNGSGAAIDGVAVALRKVGAAGGVPTFTRASIGGSTGSSSPLSGGAGAWISGFEFGGASGAHALDLRLDGMRMNGCEEAIVSVTPARRIQLGEHEVHAIRVGRFELSRFADSLRLGVEDVASPALFADVVNTDAGRDLTRIAGTYFPAPGSSAELVAIHLLNSSSGQPVAGADVSLEGAEFRVSGFNPVPAGGRVLVVGVLSEAPGFEQATRLRIEASFD